MWYKNNSLTNGKKLYSLCNIRHITISLLISMIILRLLGAMNFNFDVESISTIGFVRKLHDSAGKCLDCGLTSCKVTDKNFAEFSSNVYMERTINGPLKCSPTRPKEPETTTSRPEVQPPQDSKIVMAGNSNFVSAPSCFAILILASWMRILN